MLSHSSTPEPYYRNDYVTLYHGDARELTEWLAADLLVTDPPYGRRWRSGSGLTNTDGHGRARKCHGGIAGDHDTATRDAALSAWGARPGIVFGDLLAPQPQTAVQCLIYAKAADAGIRGARGGFRRDVEAVYLTGPWPCAVGGRTSLLRSRSWVAGPSSPAFRYGHPHAKPLDLLEEILLTAPAGIVADPFAGSGTTLVAARNLGREAIGVEIDERHCETAARRLDQMCLQFDPPTAHGGRSGRDTDHLVERTPS
ncbi:putative DNA methyltransferase (plasmid) [Mycobacteroides abscessus subsp. bolletii 50594]|uniref:Methyltransferase n=2 Tax=Mycobacteroides abscessus TaxID=36809 RepID=A0AB33AIS7_9MYCO|nr:putative DNA methyltransferase [Mycobacteroides abscessus subsp. bolletii 50594]